MVGERVEAEDGAGGDAVDETSVPKVYPANLIQLGYSVMPVMRGGWVVSQDWGDLPQ
jgi:hypothetical protein